MERWTIDELSEVVARVLEDAPAPASGRVTAVPDKRTIRYYTTLGLLDAPAEMRGRTAYYGRRHLLQLVAIKRLQTDGVKLSQVQQQLSGQPDGVLQRLARLPDALPAPEASGAAAAADAAVVSAPTAAKPAVRRRDSFWADAPGEAVEPEPSEEGRSAAAPADGTEAVAQARAMLQISVGQGAVLLVPFPRGSEGTRELLADDVAALQRAAGPLLEELARRGLSPGRNS